MKRRLSIIFLVLLSITLLLTPAYGADMVWRVLHEGANFYQDAALSVVIKTLPRNAEVEFVSEEGVALAVVYMGETGYVLKSNLYKTAETVDAGTADKKITASKLGEIVPLYQFPYEDSPIIIQLSDGETVKAVVGGVVYTGYTEVTAKGGQKGFVKNDNLTDGLTLNGIIALTVGIVTAVLVVLVLILLAYTKRMKSEKRRRQEQLIEEAREYGEQS